jgi:hypothetical protein
LSANPDSYQISANSINYPMCVLQNDGIPNGNPVTLVAPAPNTTGPFGTVTVATDTSGTICGSSPYSGQQYVQYSAPPAYVGSDSFTYQITGPSGITKQATVSVTITGVSYSAEILPILNASCRSCHYTSSSTEAPFWYYTTNSVSSSSNLYNSACVAKDMPLGGTPLTQSQCSTISLWISDGAPTTN